MSYTDNGLRSRLHSYMKTSTYNNSKKELPICRTKRPLWSRRSQGLMATSKREKKKLPKLQ